MFVGETGIGRIVRRTLEVMKELGTDDPARIRAHGAIDLPTMQRYMNFWVSSALDLFGADVSSNAASHFANGLKGRADEASYPDHVCADTTWEIDRPDGKGGVTHETVAMRNAMNEIMRGAYLKDCETGLKRWNKNIEKAGIDFRLSLPSARFRRTVGSWAGQFTDPTGRIVTAEDWQRRRDEWIPSAGDRAFIASLMQPVSAPGKIAAWIAPPDRGINNQSTDFEYVHLS